MTQPTADRVSEGGSTSAPKTGGANVMDEIISERMKSAPNMPARPGNPHYVGQAMYDAEHGMLDLNTGEFTKGEDSIKKSIADLGKESSLIKGAQDGGKSAIQDIVGPHSDSATAERELKQVIANLKDNYFNTADRNEYKQALHDLQDGHKWAAVGDISKAEQILGNRESRVDHASGQLKEGLKDFNSGKFNEGEKDMSQAMHDLQGDKSKVHVPPKEPTTPPHGSVPPYEAGRHLPLE